VQHCLVGSEMCIRDRFGAAPSDIVRVAVGVVTDLKSA
jgi:hypothetical protein